MFLDFSGIVANLQYLPSIFWSIISIFIYGVLVIFIDKKFGIIGLSCYMCFVTFVSNVQILYGTTYEFINVNALLGTTVFSSSFLACDIINTKYGAKQAQIAVKVSIVMSFFVLLSIILTLAHKPIDYTKFSNFSVSKRTLENNINAIKTIFLPLPRILLGSFCAYFASQFTEIYGHKIIKNITYLKHNVLLFCSTIVVDTFVFTLISLVILSNEALNFYDFLNIISSAIGIRIFCNLCNSLFFKIYIKKYLNLNQMS